LGNIRETYSNAVNNLPVQTNIIPQIHNVGKILLIDALNETTTETINLREHIYRTIKSYIERSNYYQSFIINCASSLVLNSGIPTSGTTFTIYGNSSIWRTFSGATRSNAIQTTINDLTLQAYDTSTKYSRLQMGFNYGTFSFGSTGGVLSYGGDYSAYGSSNPRWIPDAGWVTGQTSGALSWSGNTVNAVGTYVNSNTICANPNITIDSGGICVSKSIGYGTGAVNSGMDSYVVNVPFSDKVALCFGGASLTTGYIYRVTTHPIGTGTMGGYVGAVYWNGSNWIVRDVSYRSKVSNNMYIVESGGVVYVCNPHPSIAYNTIINIQAIGSNSAGVYPTMFGSDGMWKREQDDLIYEDGDVKICSGGELRIVSTTPNIYLTDTNTNVENYISADSSVGGFTFRANSSNNGSNPYIALQVYNNNKICATTGCTYISDNTQFGCTSFSRNNIVSILANDSYESKLEVRGAVQGTGIVFVGQDSNYGGGIAFKGDGTPTSPFPQDAITLFRTSVGTCYPVMQYSFANDIVCFNGVVEAYDIMKYNADYSAQGSSNPRWIPDNDYVTGLTTASNGLTKLNCNIKLGGELSEDTIILGNDPPFSMYFGTSNCELSIFQTRAQNIVLELTNDGDDAGSSICMDYCYVCIANCSTDQTLISQIIMDRNTGIAINVSGGTQPYMYYCQDTSAQGSSDPRWIPDAGWVTGQTSGGLSWNGSTANSFGTYVDSNTICANPKITINSNGNVCLNSTDPTITFTDSDTNVSSFISANSSVGGFILRANSSNNGSNPYFAFQVYDKSKICATTGCTYILDNAQFGNVAATRDQIVNIFAHHLSEAKLEVSGGISAQGTGIVYVGQDSSYGGGIAYKGDENPTSPFPQDAITLFRSNAGVCYPVMQYFYTSNTVCFIGDGCSLTCFKSPIICGTSCLQTTNIRINTGGARSIAFNTTSSGVGSALSIEGNNGASSSAGGTVSIFGGSGGVTVGTGGNVLICGGCGGGGTSSGGDVLICGGDGYGGGSVYICSFGGSSIGTVYLYNGTSERLRTTTSGVNVSGTMCASTCVCSPIICGSAGSGYAIRASAACGCAVDWVATSDCRMKKNIVPIIGALSKVDALCGVCYELCEDNTPDMGLIADDVLCVEPRLVSCDTPNEFHLKYGITDAAYGLKYDKFVGLLVEAIKELKNENLILQTQINELKEKIK